MQQTSGQRHITWREITSHQSTSRSRSLDGVVLHSRRTAWGCAGRATWSGACRKLCLAVGALRTKFCQKNLIPTHHRPSPSLLGKGVTRKSQSEEKKMWIADTCWYKAAVWGEHPSVHGRSIHLHKESPTANFRWIRLLWWANFVPSLVFFSQLPTSFYCVDQFRIEIPTLCSLYICNRLFRLLKT